MSKLIFCRIFLLESLFIRQKSVYIDKTAKTSSRANLSRPIPALEREIWFFAFDFSFTVLKTREIYT